LSPILSTEMLTISGLKSRLAIVAVGKSILMDCKRIMLKLASMNEASRKNMMSISGMISIRAFRCGNGDPIFIFCFNVLTLQRFNVRSTRLLNRPPKLDRIIAFLFRGLDHHFNVGCSGFQLELKMSHFAREVVKWNQRHDRNGETAHRRDEGFADAAGDLAGRALHCGISDRQKGSINSRYCS